ncbi:hypothetical protein WOLCODRAFT_158790 [Wolfiporia cocos MD-104 SS10]|uniref:Uncharacterized protein n=1 Tax=Wolfiporia cocos (strain MD-104) TaxID=742152 RepID=A0A2H3JKB3_WOLCO|nr:hypothetical protein WOLCODRAFT_158790 [Wolfiporia cocos MD-104 SS10]
MPTDWEVYLDMAIDLYKRQYPDKLKGKIFEEEKKKESLGSAKTTKKATSKPAKADDKGKGKADSGTSNNKLDCRKHPGQHQWKDCPDNKNRKMPKPAKASAAPVDFADEEENDKAIREDIKSILHRDAEA